MGTVISVAGFYPSIYCIIIIVIIIRILDKHGNQTAEVTEIRCRYCKVLNVVGREDKIVKL